MFKLYQITNMEPKMIVAHTYDIHIYVLDIATNARQPDDNKYNGMARKRQLRSRDNEKEKEQHKIVSQQALYAQSNASKFTPELQQHKQHDEPNVTS